MKTANNTARNHTSGPKFGAPKNGKPAQGSVDPKRPGYKQIVIPFECDQFDELAAHAVSQGVSFAELVRTYCVWGLETEDAAR